MRRTWSKRRSRPNPSPGLSYPSAKGGCWVPEYGNPDIHGKLARACRNGPKRRGLDGRLRWGMYAFLFNWFGMEPSTASSLLLGSPDHNVLPAGRMLRPAAELAPREGRNSLPLRHVINQGLKAMRGTNLLGCRRLERPSARGWRRHVLWQRR